MLNAVIADRFSEALQEARDLDELLQKDQLPESHNEENAPLLGIPFTAKEAFGVAGEVACTILAQCDVLWF